MALPALIDGKKIDAAIRSIGQRSNKIADDIHATAIQCMLHARPEADGGHGDPRKLDNLYKALHKAHRPQAFKTWVEQYSPVRWNGDDQVGVQSAKVKERTPFNIEAAMEDPYWTPAETVAKPLTLAALKAMIAQMEKKMAKVDKGELELADGENIVDMKAFVAKITAAAA